jgi:alpha-tubulin suppressor-like RCC1 family protein
MLDKNDRRLIRHTLILKRDGRVLACGLNNYGQLGNLDVDNQMYPVNMIYDFSQVINAVSVYAGENYSLVLLKDNTLLASGNI